MTFEDYRLLRCGDPWDPSHPGRKVERPRFARVVGPVEGEGRIVVVLKKVGHNLVQARTLSGKVITKIYHELDLIPSHGRKA